MRSFNIFLFIAWEQSVKQLVELPVIWEAMVPYYVIVMYDSRCEGVISKRKLVHDADVMTWKRFRNYWPLCGGYPLVVRRAGLLWSQEDFEWRRSVPLFKCLTVLEFSFILFDLCLLITFFNFIMNYVPIVTFWIFTYHKIWILSIMFCSIWSYWIIYFLACLEVSWRVVS